MKNIFRVKFFIEADSPKELIQTQLDNNKLFDKQFDYGDGVLTGSKWRMWYYDDISTRSQPVVKSKKKARSKK